jgi:hypothetical protein
VIENVLELLSIRSLDIKDRSSIVFEAAHSFDVICDRFRQKPSQNVPNKTDSVERLLHRNLKSDAIFLPVQKTASKHFFFMMARQQGKSLAQCFLSIASVKLN